MNIIIEVKLRFESDEYQRWEDRPILASFQVKWNSSNGKFPGAMAKVSQLMRGFEGSLNPVREARWNMHGSQQGHCIFAK